MAFFRCVLIVACCVLLAQQPAPARASGQNILIADMARAPLPIDGLPDQLFCIDFLNGLLYRVDPATGETALIAENLQTPHGLAIYQSDNGSIAEAYIAELKSGRVVRVNLLTGIKNTVAEGLHMPARLAIIKKNGAIEAIDVTQLFRGSVVRLTPDKKQPWPAEVFSRGIPFADGIALEPGGETALVSSFFFPGAITRIDIASGKKLGRLASGLLNFPAQFAGPVAVGQVSVFFVSEMFGQQITQVGCRADGACRQVNSYSHIKFPLGLALSQDNSRLFAAEAFSGRILGIDIKTGTVETMAQLPIPGSAAEEMPGN